MSECFGSTLIAMERMDLSPLLTPRLATRTGSDKRATPIVRSLIIYFYSIYIYDILDPQQLYVIFERSGYSEANLEVFHRGGEGLDTSRAFLFESMVNDHASLTHPSALKTSRSEPQTSEAERQRALATSMRSMILSLHRALLRKEVGAISDRYKEYALPPFTLYYTGPEDPAIICIYILVVRWEGPWRSKRTQSAITAMCVAFGFLAFLLLAQFGGFLTLGRPPNEPNITNIRIEIRKV